MPEDKSGKASRGKMLPPTFLFLTVVAMVALHFLLPGRVIIPFPWTLLGIAPFLAGVVLNMSADAALKRHGTTVKPFEKSSALVTDGAYRVSRHPMYLGFICILLGIAVFMGSATPYAPILVLWILIRIVFVRVEERMMAEGFGEAWSEYRARVRSWI